LSEGRVCGDFAADKIDRITRSSCASGATQVASPKPPAALLTTGDAIHMFNFLASV
jgi:hypothetical protein